MCPTEHIHHVKDRSSTWRGLPYADTTKQSCHKGERGKAAWACSRCHTCCIADGRHV